MKKSSLIIFMVLCMMLTIFLSSCFDEENYHTKTDTDALLKTLEDALTEKITANEAAITALKTEYEEKVKALEEEEGAALETDLAALTKKHNEDKVALIAKGDATQAELDALEATYAADLKALQKADTDNAAAIAALTKKHNEDKAALIAKGDATQAELDELEETYAADLKALQEADDANEAVIEALTKKHDEDKTALIAKSDATQAELDALEATYAADLKALQKTDTDNAAAIAALTKNHNEDKAALIAKSDATQAELDELISTYNTAVAEINKKLTDNETAIKNAKAELQSKLDTLTADHENDLADINDLIADLENADTASETRIAELEKQVADLLASQKHTFGDWIILVDAMCETKGVKMRICPCGASEAKEILAIGHTYDAENTCTSCLDYKDKGMVFTLQEDNTYAVTYYTENATEVIIPSKYQGVAVTSIGNSAFRHCLGLTSITIPDSVTSIGRLAFSRCSGLTSITIPNSVTNIGNDAFRSCGFESITVESGNAKYHSAENCLIETASKTLVLGSKNSIIPTDGSVTSIGNRAFSNYDELTSITIPNSVTFIDEYAFACCKLTSITIPNSVTSIGDHAFFGCEFESITVESGNTKYHSAANCLIETASKTLVLGCKNSVIPTDGSVTSIGYGAFDGCSGLTSITIPEGITSIGDRAFLDCSGLTSITIPNSVTNIGDRAFCFCRGLTSIKYRGTEAQWNTITKGSNWDSDTGSYTITYNYTGE